MWDIEITKSGPEVWVRNKHFATGELEFVARFKHANPGRSAKHFVKFLEKNFAPEEYMTQLQINRMAPVDILKTKGFVSYNVQKARG